MENNWQYGLGQINELAQKLLPYILNSKIVTFKGDLGTGKTTLLKEVCALLEVEDNVSSPTFSLVNEYHSNNHGTIFHFDLYRIESEMELLDLGFEEYLEKDALCFIEWPKIALNFIPENALEIEIEHLTTSKRSLKIILK